MTDIYAVCYFAARRLSKFSGELKDFEATHELAVMSDDEAERERSGELDPTQPAL
jgi:hypothetical protein